MSSCELLASVIPVHPNSALLHIYRGAVLISSSLSYLETMGDNLETKTAIAICISESPLAESSHLLCWEVTSLERIHQENSKPARSLWPLDLWLGRTSISCLWQWTSVPHSCKALFFRSLLLPWASWFCLIFKQDGCWLWWAQNIRK